MNEETTHISHIYIFLRSVNWWGRVGRNAPLLPKINGEKTIYAPPLLLKISRVLVIKIEKTRVTPPLLWHLTYAPDLIIPFLTSTQVFFQTFCSLLLGYLELGNFSKRSFFLNISDTFSTDYTHTNIA